MDMMILSLNAPAVQAIPDPKRANEVARKANDYLAEQVRKRPDRFQALAALPMQDPDLAAKELERCVKQLGMVGALVNGFSQIGDPDTIAYLDEQQYWPFWSVVSDLDVPFYLHPRNPLPAHARIYQGASWLLGPIWAFGQERRPAVLHVARRQLQRVGAKPEQVPGQAEDRRVLPKQLPHHHVRQLPHPGAAQHHDGGGRRPHPVFDRLAVREHRPCRCVVRLRDYQRGGPPQDRPQQRSEAVQAEVANLRHAGAEGSA
jgi:hypothetical protein